MTTKGFLPATTEKFPSSTSSLSRALTLGKNVDQEQKPKDSGDIGAGAKRWHVLLALVCQSLFKSDECEESDKK